MKFSKRTKFAVAALLLVVVMIVAIVKITVARHAFVQMVWCGIDILDDRGAEAAVLPAGVKAVTDIPYIDDGDKGHLLDVYYPESAEGQLPSIVYFHGGGFVSGDKRHVRQYCMTLAKYGYSVYNVNYRLAPEAIYSTQLTDVLTAVDWVQANGAVYHGDGSKMVLAGDSAGAYLAASAARVSTDPAQAEALGVKMPAWGKVLKGVLLFNGVYDMETGSTRKFPAIKSDIEMFLGVSDISAFKNPAALSVTANITGTFPPAFISSGEVDALHAESVELVKALVVKGIFHEALLFDKTEKKAAHGYYRRLDLAIARQCLEAAMEFLQKVAR